MKQYNPKTSNADNNHVVSVKTPPDRIVHFVENKGVALLEKNGHPFRILGFKMSNEDL